jgi:L-rhamnose-H+ transport protein
MNLLGAVAVVLGVGVCGFAGRARERQQETGVMAPRESIGIPGALYSLSLLRKNRSTSLYRQKETGGYWLLVVVMGGLWLGSIVVYGDGVARIGVLGPVVGWPVFMSGAVIASAAWGTVFGEWKNSGTTAKAAMTSGVFCLVVAIVILGKGAP